MKAAKIRFKDIYPVALFFTFLMMWGLVGETQAPYHTASLVEWGQFRKIPSVSDACQENRFFLRDSLCESREEKSFLPWMQEKREPTRLLTKVDKKYSAIRK
jgi:hypothetical protein